MELNSICLDPISIQDRKKVRHAIAMDVEAGRYAIVDADTWADRLYKMWRRTGWSKRELARRSGVSKDNVYKYLKGEVKQPRGNTLDLLADALGVCRLWLREGVGPQFYKLPITGQLMFGENIILADDPMQAASYGSIDFDLSTGDPVVIKVQGDSLHPSYRPGDHLVCSRAYGNDIEAFIGKDCVVRTENGEAYIKILTRGGKFGTFTLESYGHKYPEIRDARLKWAARIVWVRRG